MQSLTGKNTGDILTAAEWNQLPTEVQNIITASGQTLSSGDLNQLGKAVPLVVSTKAQALTVTPENGRKIFITSDDGGLFTMKTGAVVGTYDDNGGAATGTKFTAGDGSSGFLRDFSGAFNAKWFGLKGDGTTDDTAARALAITYLESIGGGTLYFPEGVYGFTAEYNVTGDNIKLLGDGDKLTQWKKLSAHGFLSVGDRFDWITTESNTLNADAAIGDVTITLSPGKGANFTADTWVALISDAVAEGGPSVTNKQAEFIHIRSISVDTLTLSRPLRYGYTTADNAEINRIPWIYGFEIDGIGFDGNSHLSGAGQNQVTWMNWCFEPVIKNCSAWELPNWCFGLTGCFNAKFDMIYGRDFKSDGYFGDVGNFGYGIVELDLNEGLVATNLSYERVRHGYTTATLGLLYGVPTGSRISDGVSEASLGSGWDTHPEGSDITFTSCISIGSLGHGLQERAVRTKWVGCTSRDAVGVALLFSQDAIDCEVDNLSYSQTNKGQIQGIGTDWSTKDVIQNDGTRNSVNGVYRKTADQTVNNSTVLVDATNLSFKIEKYAGAYFEATIRYVSSSVADLKLAVTGPAGSTLVWSLVGGLWNTGGVFVTDGESASGSAKSIQGVGGTRVVHLTGYIDNGSTEGNVDIQFAQDTAEVSNTIIQKNSFLKIIKQ